MLEFNESTFFRAGSSVQGSIPVNAYNAPITTVKMNGTNFLPWPQSMKLTTMGRGKWGYITWLTKTPNLDYFTYSK